MTCDFELHGQSPQLMPFQAHLTNHWAIQYRPWLCYPRYFIFFHGLEADIIADLGVSGMTGDPGSLVELGLKNEYGFYSHFHLRRTLVKKSTTSSSQNVDEDETIWGTGS